MKRYTIEDKPKFHNNQTVRVDFSCFSSSISPDIRYGKIVGKGMEHIIDHWVVDFGSKISDEYPYQAALIQHTFIVDEREYFKPMLAKTE